MFSSVLDIVSCPNSYADVPNHYALLIFLKYHSTNAKILEKPPFNKNQTIFPLNIN